MGKNKFLDNLTGIPRPRIDESKLDKPTRPPPQHQKLAEDYMQGRRLPIKKPPLEEKPEPRVPLSITPQIAEEARATHERLRRMLDKWDNKETPDPKEFFFTGRSKLDQIRLAIHFKGKTRLNILVMESLCFYQDTIKLAIETVVPKYFPDITQDDWQVVNCLRYALFNIQNNSVPYDVIFLAHKIHERTSVLTEEDPEFQKSLESIGYTLIDVIRSVSTDTIIIGTAIGPELSAAKMPPDFTMRKRWGEATKSLEGIMEAIHRTSKRA